MSLVNDLLEDFYQRRVSPDKNPESPLANIEVPRRELAFKKGARVQPKFNSTSRIVIGLVALTCLAVIALEVVLRLSPDIETNATPDVSARPPDHFGAMGSPLGSGANEPFADSRALAFDAGVDSLAAPKIAAQDWAELTGTSIESSGDYTRLRIFLSREREYWIQGDPTVGEIEIVITKTRLAEAFLPNAFETSGLSLKEAHNSSIGLHLLFKLESSSLVQSQFVNDGSNPQLILDILSDAANSSVGIRVEDLPHAPIVAEAPREPIVRETGWGTITRSRPHIALTTSEAHRSLDRARHLVAQNRAEEAIVEYIRALSLEPGLHRARESLVGLLIESGQLSAAERHLAMGLENKPAHSEYTLLRAQLLAAMKQPDRAIVILESLPLPPERRSDALNLLAALYQQKGDHGRAEALFRSAVSISPHEARLWMGLGISLEGQQRGTEALAVYKQAESLAEFEIGPRRWLRNRIRDLAKVE